MIVRRYSSASPTPWASASASRRLVFRRRTRTSCRAALLLFFLLPPAGLVQYLGWLAVPVSVAVASFFGLINTIGDHLQDPFENHSTDTAMDAICRTIEINLRQQLGESDLPPAIEPVDGVLM